MRITCELKNLRTGQKWTSQIFAIRPNFVLIRLLDLCKKDYKKFHPIRITLKVFRQTIYEADHDDFCSFPQEHMNIHYHPQSKETFMEGVCGFRLHYPLPADIPIIQLKEEAQLTPYEQSEFERVFGKMRLKTSERRYILFFWVKGNEQLQSQENITGEKNWTQKEVLKDLSYNENGQSDD